MNFRGMYNSDAWIYGARKYLLFLLEKIQTNYFEKKNIMSKN